MTRGVLDSFLEDVPFPRLSEEDRQMLEDPLTVEELGEALHTMQTGKSPGPDGYLVEWHSITFFTY